MCSVSHWTPLVTHLDHHIMALRKFFLVYWRPLFAIIFPLVLISVVAIENTPAVRCLYVVLLMAGYSVTEPVPLVVTSVIPIVLFPLMGILDSDKTTICYLNETNIVTLGGLIIAIAVEHCNLHRRAALHVILWVGCSARKLNFSLVAVTMFASIWISSTSAITMICPIMKIILKELEDQGIGSVYENEKGHLVANAKANKDKNDVSKDGYQNETQQEEKRPSNMTICYSLGAAYASSIGEMGRIVGNDTILAFQTIYETRFPDSPSVGIAAWLFLAVPIMLITMFLACLWLQFRYMGLFKPNSEDAKRVKLGKQEEQMARANIKLKLEGIGPISFHEAIVGLIFVLAVFLWFFTKLLFIVNRAKFITEMKVNDTTTTIIIVMLLLIIPAKPGRLYMFNKDESKRSTTPSPALVPWEVVQHKLPFDRWEVILLLGGGLALAEGANASGLNILIADSLRLITQLPRFAVLVTTFLFASILTEFFSNVAVANVLLPILAEISVAAQWNPLYLMIPVTLACSHAFSLPFGTPPNDIARVPHNISTKEMVSAGLGVKFISSLVLFAIFLLLGPSVFGVNEFPSWAGNFTGN